MGAQRSVQSATTPVRGPEAPAKAPQESPELSEAREALYRAQGAVQITEAQLQQALDAAPRVSPRMAAATTALETARKKAVEAAREVDDRRRALADAEGDLEAAQALAEDLEAGESTTPGKQVAARVRVEKRTRAVESASYRLLEAQEAQASSEARLAEAEERQVEASRARGAEPVEVVKARVAHDSAVRAVESAQDRLTELTAKQDSSASEGPLYASLDAFVEGYLLPQWRHRLGGSTQWCGYWFRHAEAVSRLEAVWEAWEVIRREPAPSLSTWWRDHLDPHMRALTDPDGTFNRCSAVTHDEVHWQSDSWPAYVAPEGMFATDPNAPEQPKRVQQSQESKDEDDPRPITANSETTGETR